jgi:hypothetical protein
MISHSTNSPRNRRLLRAAALVAILLSLPVYLWVTRPTERLLERMASYKLPWLVRVGGQQAILEGWFSDNEALRLFYDGGHHVDRVTRVDIRTGASRDIPRLAAAVRATGAVVGDLSPDARWLCCWTPGPRFREELYAVALDGSRTIRWPAVRRLAENVVHTGWTPDSHGYLVLYVNEAVIYPLDRKQAIRRIRIPGLPPEVYACDVSPDGQVVAVNLESGLAPAVVYHFRLDERAPGLKRFDVRPPAGHEIVSAIPNLRTGRIAWELRRWDVTGRRGWRERLMRLLGSKPHHLRGVWISRLDGTALEELGHVHSLDSGLQRWLPNGRALEYVAEDTLYVVPAP